MFASLTIKIMIKQSKLAQFRLYFEKEFFKELNLKLSLI